MKKTITCIGFRDNLIDIDGCELHFPLSLGEITDALGEAEIVEDHQHGGDIRYVYHELGIIFTKGRYAEEYLKKRNSYIDEEHEIISISLYGRGSVYSRRKREGEIIPAKPCKARVEFKGRTSICCEFLNHYGTTEYDNLSVYCFKGDWDGYFDKRGRTKGEMSIVFSPPKPSRPHVSYKIKPCKEEVLEFEHFNFKLAIIQVLMYELEVLSPYFDIYDFAEQYNGKEIDTDSEKPIRPAINFFKKLPIPKRLAEKVEEISMDGGDEIYGNIIPQWDGEDDFFDLDEVSESELAQFPNLKKAVIMSNQYDKVSETFIRAGIEVESL
ncbi:MAG: hypothetical protein HDT41_01845 [Lachnospiraceae bacterium]|nr:hypothetical protein [Lachnospiraceae bacterium]